MRVALIALHCGLVLGFSGRFKLLNKDSPWSNSRRCIATDGDPTQATDVQQGGTEANLAELIELVIKSVDAGRQDNLAAAGLKVTMKSERETMDKKMMDPELVEKVLGSIGEDEKEIMKLLDESMASSTDWMGQGYDESVSRADIDMDPLLFNELKEDLLTTLDSVRGRGSAMVQLFDNNIEFNVDLNVASSSGTVGTGADSENQRFVDRALWGPALGTATVLTSVGGTDIEIGLGEPPYAINGEIFEIEDGECEPSASTELAIQIPNNLPQQEELQSHQGIFCFYLNSLLTSPPVIQLTLTRLDPRLQTNKHLPNYCASPWKIRRHLQVFHF